MLTTPKLLDLPAKHFAVVRIQAAIPFGELVQPAHQEVNTWLKSKGLAPSGAPIIRYLTTDMSTKLDMEIGWQVAQPVDGDGRIIGITLPAGQYAAISYFGPYEGDGLYNANRELVEWIAKNNVPCSKKVIDGVEWWDARYESYETDPGDEPDPQKWQTDVLFLTEH